jgi:hypothetical protein
MRQESMTRLIDHFPAELQERKATFELPLDDRSKLTFALTQGGSLSIQCWRPGSDRYGHGFLLAGSTLLSGGELTEFMSELLMKETPQ